MSSPVKVLFLSLSLSLYIYIYSYVYILSQPFSPAMGVVDVSYRSETIQQKRSTQSTYSHKSSPPYATLSLFLPTLLTPSHHAHLLRGHFLGFHVCPIHTFNHSYHISIYFELLCNMLFLKLNISNTSVLPSSRRLSYSPSILLCAPFFICFPFF